MIFEGWNGTTMQWKATTDYGCSNGISACYITVPMARADDITGQVLYIEENGQYPYLAMPEVWHQVAWIQVHQMSEPSVKAGWFDPAISREDRPMIKIPPHMKAAGCVSERGKANEQID
ncbi:hypothetical protein U0C82_02630 [Fulvimarina sp. 2208YS6-2-32]|uniref:Uncharacterized protein n=1 Tax=Fulvimarina uroteuthidis TaxID=3098149 RepID=A0ABU5HY30_9HYPH|nr:hypothetical protein [Fulvimarina sp. 2208YS6-2-32]MDY8108045.1 hypothetical protein [Fulvimarina sp. 2208YS6-2-32]